MLKRMTATTPGLEVKVAYLRGLCARGDEAIETHFAWVFLIGDRAFKLRKPAARDTMDHRSLDARRAGTFEEIRLNRRLAPSVYLEALPLTSDAAGGFAIGGRGTVVDWLVCMRRLDRMQMLDAQLLQSAFDTGRLEPAAHRLADFYRSSAPAIADGAAWLARLQRQVAANHAALSAAARPDTDRLAQRQLQALQRHQVELARRATAGCVIEAHGDLRPEHVFLGEPPEIIDCLEFDRDLRILDRAEELSFLELECTRLGRADAGIAIRRATLAALHDAASAGLLAFYRSHRGATRAKLYGWRASEPDAGTPHAWLDRADDYLAGALADAGLALD